MLALYILFYLVINQEPKRFMTSLGEYSLKGYQGTENSNQTSQTPNITIQDRSDLNFTSVKCGNRFTILQDGKS